MKSTPDVSVIMANYRGGSTLAAAVTSVCAQSLRAVEVIVSDDASDDESLAIARRLAEADPRVRVLAAERNGGPGAARNRALAAARGKWIAIQDSDDLVHPMRLCKLLLLAEALGADAIADDLIFTDATGRATGETLLGAHPARGPQWITPEDFVRANTVGSGLPALGYLKPVFRRAALGDLRYDETARIGEDYEFLLGFLASGRTLAVIPQGYYLYRRHAGSISHRLSADKVREMIASHDRFVAGQDGTLGAALAQRRAGLVQALAYEDLVAALKARHLLQALGQLARRPGLLVNLFRSLREHFAPPPPAGAVESDARLELTALPVPDAPAVAWARLAARAGGAAHLVAAGEAGAFALGYLPNWRTARINGAPEAAAAVFAALPRQGVTVRDAETAGAERQVILPPSLCAAIADLQGRPAQAP